LTPNGEARKALRREFVVFQGDTADSLKNHEKTVRAVSGDITKLRQAMEELAANQNIEIPELAEEMDMVAEAVESGEEEITEEPEPDTQPENAVKRSKETQEYIDLVESTFQKFIRLTKEGFATLWDYFSSLIDKFTKS